jgi:hypothetical protein
MVPCATRYQVLGAIITHGPGRKCELLVAETGSNFEQDTYFGKIALLG